MVFYGFLMQANDSYDSHVFVSRCDPTMSKSGLMIARGCVCVCMILMWFQLPCYDLYVLQCVYVFPFVYVCSEFGITAYVLNVVDGLLYDSMSFQMIS